MKAERRRYFLRFASSLYLLFLIAALATYAGVIALFFGSSILLVLIPAVITLLAFIALFTLPNSLQVYPELDRKA